MNKNKAYKILLVDDDTSILRSLFRILDNNKEYEILTAVNGKMACAIACVEKPNLIIMDWEMPVMNGVEAIDVLKKNEVTKDIPVIITSGVMIEPSHLNTAFVAGAVDYIRKPINEIELKARIANMIRISELTQIIKKQNANLINQLTSEALKIQQLHEMKRSTIRQLTDLKENEKVVDEKMIKDAIQKTERLLNSKEYQTNWVDFESHFEIIHPGFFKKISMQFEHLTVNDLRLCAFIKLNMTNKEIAQINYTSADSVNTSRKRLKKKLGLQPKDSLQLFVRNL